MEATIGTTGELSAKLIRKDGSVEDIGLLTDKRLRVRFLRWLSAHPMIEAFVLRWFVTCIVTTAGVNYMATDFASGGVTPTISGFKFHDSGTGVGGAVVGDTALGTATGIARVSGTASNPSANVYKSVATIAYNNTFAVTEWGLFSASSSGTLWDRRTFSAINVVNGDSIQFSYSLTVNNGGS